MDFYLIRLKKLDWFLILAIFILIIAGLISLLSHSPNLFWRQLIWSIFFFLIVFSTIFFDWSSLIFQNWFRHLFYWLGIFLLIAVRFQKGEVRGTKSWFVFGSFQFEPSELMKVAFILMLAGFFSRRYVAAWLTRNIFISFFYTLIPTVLIISQPDLGSALVFLIIWLGFLFMSGFDKKKLIIGLILVAIFLVFLWFYYLEPYQKERIIGFLFPNYDPLGINYNAIQAKIAIGSAGFFGKGFSQGTQSKLGFLPEAYSDFIFAAFVEEWGIFGGILIIAIFLFILYRLSLIGIQARDNYSKFIVLGTMFLLLAHFTLNLGANLNFLPITGITFPFFSYGGSSLLTLAILLSIIENTKIESSK